MKKLLVILIVLIVFSGCTWSRNLHNEKVRVANMTILAGEGYRELYLQSLLASELLSQLGTIKAPGVDYLLDLAALAEAESNKVQTITTGFTRSEIASRDVEKHMERLKAEVFKLSAAIRAFLANESIGTKEKE